MRAHAPLRRREGERSDSGADTERQGAQRAERARSEGSPIRTMRLTASQRAKRAAKDGEAQARAERAKKQAWGAEEERSDSVATTERPERNRCAEGGA